MTAEATADAIDRGAAPSDHAAPFELDRTAHAVVLRRRLAAPPVRIFAAWTRPEQISQWWDPSGRPLAACEVDPREGGVLRLVNQGGEAHPFEGRFREVDPPYGFSFDALGAAGSVRFEPDRDGTRMTVTIRCASAEDLARFVQMGIPEGTGRSLDNLAGYVGEGV